MGTETKIQWCRHTWNPWRGCAEVHAGCDNCYARTMSRRNPGTLGVWGPTGTRVVAAEAQWKLPVKWNREAKAAGVRKRVFCASLADVFEDWTGRILDSKGRTMHRASDWSVWDREWIPVDGVSIGRSQITMADVRARLFALIDATPNLDWLLVTKRPENVRKMWPHKASDYDGFEGRTAFRANVWLLTSISDQQTADAMIPELLKCRDLCPVLGLSAEPLLGPVDLFTSPCRQCNHPGDILEWPCRYCKGRRFDTPDWVIIGGESGPDARPCNVAWIRDLVGQCKELDVPAFVKQLGGDVVTTSDRDEWPGGNGLPADGHMRFEPNGFGAYTVHGLRDKKGGDPAEWPEDLRVREFPEVRA